MSDTLPTVSVVMPARNAAAALPRALDSIAGQTYPNIVEVVVACADPESRAAASRDGVTVVDNPSGTTPAALNLAVAATTGDVVVRCDAQSVLPADYVETAVRTMMETGASNVGGMQVPMGTTFWERSIAAAMASLLGAGDARYRRGGEPGPVETVYLGVFRRDVLLDLGGFDETFVRTQDYEMNHRIIESGGVVWFDPALRVSYTPRGSLGSLWRQYYEYGRAKRAMARKHRGSLRPRQLAPPLLVLLLAASLAASLATPWALVIPVGYLALLVIGAATLDAPTLGTALALLTMHVSWGLGFLRG